MRQRVYDKQNNSTMPYQLRTRQYTQLDQQFEYVSKEKQPRKEYSYYDANKFEDKKNNLEDSLPYDKKSVRQNAYDYSYTKPNRPEGIGNYGKKRYQLTQKVDLDEDLPRFNNIQTYNKRQDALADHSFGQNSFQTDVNVSTLLPNKRQNAKRKGIQIKMTNIENINDKINSLLSMVKKGKIDRSSKQKFMENSPKRLLSPSSNMNRANPVENYPIFSNKQALKSGTKTPKIDSNKDIDKSSKRLKTYSNIQQGKYHDYSYNQIKQANEQDRRISESPYSPKKYSPTKSKPTIKSDYDYQKKYSQKDPNVQNIHFNQYKYTPIKQRLQKKNDQSIRKNTTEFKKSDLMKNNESKIQSKYQISDKLNKQERISPYQKQQKTPTKQKDSNYLPITLLQNQKKNQKSIYERNQQIQGMKIVDNQLKKIKEKISESQYQYKKYQQRLTGNREQRSPSNAGKIYNTDISNPTKKFQIKVHPVINDKPQTVKIAQKLCYQIEVDKRMRKARQSFEAIQGQQKWRDLQEKLNKQSLRLTFIQLKELLSLTPDQYSPFGSAQGSEQDILKPFIDSQKFWEKQVSGCASSKALRKEGFSINELDLNKKNYLSIEDIVCFVNLYTGHFYKNRDLTVIFRRLQLLEKFNKGTQIEYNTFFRAFTI